MHPGQRQPAIAFQLAQVAVITPVILALDCVAPVRDGAGGGRELLHRVMADSGLLVVIPYHRKKRPLASVAPQPDEAAVDQTVDHRCVLTAAPDLR